QQDRINLISGNRETSSRLPALAYSPRKLSRRPAPSQTPRRRSIEVEPEGGQAMLAKSTGRKSMHRPFRQLRLLSAYLSGVVGFLGLSAAEAGDVLTQHYNNARTGATLEESVLNTANVGSGIFLKLWTTYADGQIVAQPLYVSDLQIDTTANPAAPPVKGKFNA